MKKSDEIISIPFQTNIEKKRNHKNGIKNDKDHKITQYYKFSNKNKNDFNENQNNLNESNSKNKTEDEENSKKNDSIKKKRNYSSFSSSEKIISNDSIELITKIYGDYTKTINISSIEESFIDCIKNKIILDDNKLLRPNAQNNDGSNLLTSSYFWVLYIEFKLKSNLTELKSETFFDLFEYATECCNKDEKVLINYYYDYIKRNISKDDIISRINRIKISEEFIEKIDQSDFFHKNCKFAIKNHKFFENENIQDLKMSSGKKKKVNKELCISREKENKNFREVSKNFQQIFQENGSDIKIAENTLLSDESDYVSKAFPYHLNKSPETSKNKKLKIENIVKFELSDCLVNEKTFGDVCNVHDKLLLYKEIINIQNLSISSNDLQYEISFVPKAKKCDENFAIENVISFTVTPLQKVKKRLSFVNNYEQKDFSFSNYSMRRDNYLDVTIWKKIEMYKDSESIYSTKSKRSKSFGSDSHDSNTKNDFKINHSKNKSDKSRISDEEIIICEKYQKWA